MNATSTRASAAAAKPSESNTPSAIASRTRRIRHTLWRHARPPLRQVHLPEARFLVAAPRIRRPGARQGRVRGRVQRLRRGPLPPRLLAGGHAWRRRPDDPRLGALARADPRAARGPQPERPHAPRRDQPLVPRDDEGIGLLGRAPAAEPARGIGPQVPDRLPDVEEARVVPAPGRGADADHAQPHRGRTPLRHDRDQHRLFFRNRRPGIRGFVQRGRSRGIPGSGAGAERHGIERVHRERDADLHLPLGLRGEGARRTRRGDRGRPPDPFLTMTTTFEEDTEIRDITVIGAGPVGLITSFWAGMREASSRIIDSLPDIGGQLTTLYPEKWIYDVPGYPRVLAKDL